jgi:serine/threonine protein phosphatase PrpC
MKYAIVQDSRVGARHINQDRIGTWRTPASLLMVVADGLGGHLHGEVAAQIAIALVGAAFTREAQPKLADPEAFLGRVFGAAHAAILLEAQKLELADAPRTVIVACVVQGGYAYWTHVGDSRLYVLRQGQVLHRTRDHTLVQQLVDQGRVREEAMTTHPERNRLLQCLGGYQAPRPEPASRARLARNDVVLLCSDGFWGPLTQRQIIDELLSRQLKEAIPELASLAERRAGPDCDNVSVLAMTWGEEEVAADEGPPTIPRYDLPTDVQDLTATDLDFMRMSDEDVEKAIAEIKAALRKNTR